MSRLTLFAKGNLDLRDCLHSLRFGDELAWNGINEIVRESHPGWTIRVRHETWTRSDALLAATGDVPADLAARGLDLDAFPAASQFSTAVFDTDSDAIVLSIQPDLATPLMRHRREGYLFYPNRWWTWPSTDQAWLRASFETADPPDVAAAMRDFAAVVDRMRSRTAAPILVFNVSSAIPGERLHSHQGMEDILSTRMRRFNLALIELSQRTGISVIDVDAILARAGGDRLKLDALHLNAEGCRLVAEDVVRVLDDLNLFGEAETSS